MLMSLPASVGPELCDLPRVLTDCSHTLPSSSHEHGVVSLVLLALSSAIHVCFGSGRAFRSYLLDRSMPSW